VQVLEITHNWWVNWWVIGFQNNWWVENILFKNITPCITRGCFQKRVRRFERPTFTLATCKSTDVTASRTPISGDSEKGVAKTVATCAQDEVLNQLNKNWTSLPEHIKLAIQALVDTA